MGDALVTDQWVDHGRIDAAQADVGAAGRSHRPGVGPAVAVEHRQGPEIDRIAAESKGQHVADGIQIGAAAIGRASGRGRGCKYGWSSGVAGSLKKKKKQ